jgi:TonB family protein
MKSPLAFFAALLAGAGLLAGLAAPAARADPPADVPSQVAVQVAPTYPVRAAKAGLTAGKARLALRIDPVGRLDDALVIAYSEREFADAAMLAVSQWRFKAGRVNGEPAFGLIEVTFEFDVNKPLANARIGPQDETYFGADKYQYEAVSPGQLDQPPTPTHTVNPTYPRDWAQRGLTGSVVVDFYIDEQGRVRMPEIVSADQPELAWIVLPAIVKWHFAPPIRKGQPVLVKAEQTFAF